MAEQKPHQNQIQRKSAIKIVVVVFALAALAAPLSARALNIGSVTKSIGGSLGGALGGIIGGGSNVGNQINQYLGGLTNVLPADLGEKLKNTIANNPELQKLLGSDPSKWDKYIQKANEYLQVAKSLGIDLGGLQQLVDQLSQFSNKIKSGQATAQDFINFDLNSEAAQLLDRATKEKIHQLQTTLEQIGTQGQQKLNELNRTINQAVTTIEELRELQDKVGSLKVSEVKEKLEQEIRQLETQGTQEATARVAQLRNTLDEIQRRASEPLTLGAGAPGGAGGTITVGGAQNNLADVAESVGEDSEGAGGALELFSFGSADTTQNICNQLFSGDQTNIFKEIVCSLTKIVAQTVADLATSTTCTIQGVGISSNYHKGIKFDNQCDTTGGWTAGQPISPPLTIAKNIRHPFGNKQAERENSTGLYGAGATGQSQLTQNIASGSTKNTFNITRTLMAVAAFVALLIFAFANILHIDINSYSVKKALPSILIALVGGSLSLSIVFVLSRTVDYLYRLNIFDPANSLNPMRNIFSGITSWQDTVTGVHDGVSLVFNMGQYLLGGENLTPGAAGGAQASFIAGVFGTILLTVPAVIVVVFQYVLALRPFAVSLLTIAAPIAFACLVLPQTQIVFRKWWTYLLIAIFYAPIVNFVLYITWAIGQGGSGQVYFIAIWVFKIFVFIALIRLPFTLESDIRKITARLAKTSFGEALGLGKIVATSAQAAASKMQVNASKVAISAGESLTSPEGKKVVAPTSRVKQIFSRNIGEKAESLRQAGAAPYITRTAAAGIAGAIADANRANLERSTPLLVRSVSDLPSDTFKTIIDQSDLKLWRDTRLIEQLKNKEGQLLNNEGVALRADSVRKIVRLAQVSEGGRLANPDAIRVLAQKGALGNLPLPVIRDAITQGVLAKSDLRATYQNNSDRLFEKLQSREGMPTFKLDMRQAREMMALDQKDYQTGFKDLAKMFERVSRDERIIPPPPPPIIRDIIHKMREVDGNVFEKHGMYYLERLSSEKNSAHKSIASVMQKMGAPAQTAIAVAQNPKIDYEQSKNYVAREKSAPEDLNFLREGFMNRDLADNLMGEVSKLVSQERSLMGKGITQKLADTLKASDPAVDLAQIRDSMQAVAKKLSRPLSPHEASEAAREVNKYHPATAIITASSFTQADMDKIRSNAEEVGDTVEDLIEMGVRRELLTENPEEAKKKIGDKIDGEIQAAATAAERKKEDGRAAEQGTTEQKVEKVSETSVEQIIQGEQARSPEKTPVGDRAREAPGEASGEAGEEQTGEQGTPQAPAGADTTRRDEIAGRAEARERLAEAKAFESKVEGAIAKASPPQAQAPPIAPGTQSAAASAPKAAAPENKPAAPAVLKRAPEMPKEATQPDTSKAPPPPPAAPPLRTMESSPPKAASPTVEETIKQSSAGAPAPSGGAPSESPPPAKAPPKDSSGAPERRQGPIQPRQADTA